MNNKDDIRYFVKFDNEMYMGYEGEDIHPMHWYLAKQWDNLEEAHRWASQVSNGRMWLIRTWDIEQHIHVHSTAMTTPEQAAEWLAKQDEKFPAYTW